MKDWNQWVRDHQYPELATAVLRWLERHDFDESVWQAADEIVDLLAHAPEERT